MKSKGILSAEELAALPDLPLEHLSGYVSIPEGYTCKVAKDYGSHLLFNAKTKHVIVYGYSETTNYGDSPNDIQYNGHYNPVEEYEA